MPHATPAQSEVNPSVALELIRRMEDTLTWSISHKTRHLDHAVVADVRSSLDAHCVAAHGSERLVDEISEPGKILAVVGRGGSGKTTTIVRALMDLDQRHGGRAGWIYVDMHASQEELGFDPAALAGLPPERASETLTRDLRARIRKKYLPDHEMAGFEAWLFRKLAEPVVEDPSHPFYELKTLVEEKVRKLMGSDEGPRRWNPMDPDQRRRYILEDPTGRWRRTFEREVEKEVRSRHYIAYLLDKDGGKGFARFVVVYDNVDLLPDEVQSRFPGILDSVIRGTMGQASGVLCIREENVEDITNWTDDRAGRPRRQKVAIRPDSQHRYYLQFDAYAIEALDEEPKGEDGEPALTRAVTKRWDAVLRKMSTKDREEEEAWAFIRRVWGGIADSYLQAQMYNHCNQNLRAFLATLWRFLRHLVLHDLAATHTLVAMDAEERRRAITTLYYKYLFCPHDHRDLKPSFTPLNPWEGLPDPKAEGIPLDPRLLLLQYLAAARHPRIGLERRQVRRSDVAADFQSVNLPASVLAEALRQLEPTGSDYVERRPMQAPDGKTDELLGLTPLGFEAVTNLFHRVFFVVHGSSAVPPREPAPEGLPEQVAVFTRHLSRRIENHLTALWRMGAVARTHGDRGWRERYETLFAVPRYHFHRERKRFVCDGGDRALDVDRLITNVEKFLPGGHGKAHVVENLKSRWTGGKAAIARGRNPLEPRMVA